MGQIVFYLLGAFLIGAAGSWVLRSRLAEDSHEHLRQRFRQMVSSSEMERDAAKLRVRELSVEVRTLEEELEQLRKPAGGDGPEDEDSALDVKEAEVEETDPAPPINVAGTNGVATDTNVEPALPQSPDTNGGGVQFELAEEAALSEPIEPDEAAQDAVLAHTWASADPSASAPQSAAGPTLIGRPFSDLGDIAPGTSEQLRSMGIHNTSDLNRHFLSGVSPSELAVTLNVEVRKVRRWRVLSELMEVPKVGPESAWLLEISGLASVGELAAEDPGELASRMAALNADQGLGLPVPDRAVVESWVQWASSSTSSPGSPQAR
ncbi:MAG: DUF4332 domain-containing protein [Longimicrobiales bacterium]